MIIVIFFFKWDICLVSRLWILYCRWFIYVIVIVDCFRKWYRLINKIKSIDLLMKKKFNINKVIVC